VHNDDTKLACPATCLGCKTVLGGHTDYSQKVASSGTHHR